MSKRSLLDSRLLAIFGLGCLALLYPLISLFNRETTVWGIPLLLAYIYSVWGALIALAAIVAKGRSEGDGEC